MADNTEKLVKLVGLARDLHDKMTHVLDEFDAILEGKASIGELMKQGRAAWDQAWSARYGPSRYVWMNQREMPHLKRLVKMLGVPEFAARAGRYIQNSDPFLTERRHSFSVFVATINQYAGQTNGNLELTTPVGCDHEPPCKSDVEHTKRTRAAMRARI